MTAKPSPIRLVVPLVLDFYLEFTHILQIEFGFYIPRFPFPSSVDLGNGDVSYPVSKVVSRSRALDYMPLTLA